ncbi:hypothetical protein [Pelagicoccus sp. SDUM812003]|uniref:hypothetical protein n=1 Tax=Pelagicoccus sp. SDUM812003 TaxID=3041267 RepID=UPI00280C6162|nr:hypothetical protein [Pelagicoccus sp. SDUM812003]MDQ8203613.1 hypothetical protein [Pelagicoccus sp. SDUM812003]
MFQRVEYSEWHTLFPKIGFLLFFLAFVVIVWKAAKMKKGDRDRSSRMPLDD